MTLVKQESSNAHEGCFCAKLKFSDYIRKIKAQILSKEGLNDS